MKQKIFTPLEKTIDEAGDIPFPQDDRGFSPEANPLSAEKPSSNDIVRKRSSLTGFTILIIDSDSNILDNLALGLSIKGHQIMFALDLGMAMEFMNNKKLDLIIIGAGEIENQLKKVIFLKNLLPFIPIFTIMGNEIKKEKYRKLLFAGVSRFINTPFDIEKLEKMIKISLNSFNNVNL